MPTQKVNKQPKPASNTKKSVSLYPSRLPDIKAMLGSNDLSETMNSIVSIDGGNGKQAMYWLHDGKLKRSILPHAITPISGKKLNADWSGQVDIPYADFTPLGRMGYTDAIWQLPSTSAQTHQLSKMRYGSVQQVFYALVNAAELGIPDETELTAVVTVPPGMYEDVKDQVVQGFMEGQDGDGWWEISLSRDHTRSGKERPKRYKFNRVVVLMEGEAAWAGYRYDLDGNIMDIEGTDGQDALSGAIRIGDGGFGTYDEFVIQNGLIVTEGIDAATDTSGGILTLMCEPLAAKIAEKSGAPNVSTAYADFVLRGYANGYTDTDGNFRKAWTEEAATITLNGRVLHLKDYLDALCRTSARWVLENKIDRATATTVMDGYMMVGGIWNFASSEIIQARPKNFFIHPAMATHTKHYSFFEINAVGSLAFAAANIRAHMS